MHAVAQAERPLAHRFFKEALENQRLAHAYVLKGRAYGEMYRLALCIAQVLNCQNPPSAGEACGECTDCKWILNNSHPAVTTLSRLTYQVSETGEDLDPEALEKLAKKATTPTQIKTEQIERLLAQLGLSSKHKRVIIFTDAEELPASMPSDVVAPYEWRALKANEDKSFHIRPLERKLFNAASANRFLKTLEEPLPNTLFFFIAETEEQLLETIVSRCQVIPYASACTAAYGAVPDVYQAWLEGFILGFRRGMPDVYQAAGEFEQFFVAEQGLSLEQALELFQLYLRSRFLYGTPDAAAFARYRAAQLPLDEAIRMLRAKTNEAQVLLALFLNLREPLAML